jgi:hypothetical protein
VRRFAVSLAIAACLTATGTGAATPEYMGIGFYCRFHAGLDRLVPFSVWYGRVNKAGPTPQVRDTAKLFALAGLEARTRMTIYVSDKWPEQFTLNYFEERGKGRPSSLFTVIGEGSDAEEFLAEIAQLSLQPDPADADRITASKRYKGICKAVVDTTRAAFEARLPA